MGTELKNEKLELKWKLLAFFFPYFLIDSSTEFYHQDNRIKQMRIFSGWGLVFYMFLVLISLFILLM
jgi:hypothetical protein